MPGDGRFCGRAAPVETGIEYATVNKNGGKSALQLISKHLLPAENLQTEVRALILAVIDLFLH